MSAHFYAVIAIPRPTTDPHRVSVATGDLPALRGRVLAAGATVTDDGPTSLAFRDPAGVRVEIVADR